MPRGMRLGNATRVGDSKEGCHLPVCVLDLIINPIIGLLSSSFLNRGDQNLSGDVVAKLILYPVVYNESPQQV